MFRTHAYDGAVLRASACPMCGQEGWALEQESQEIFREHDGLRLYETLQCQSCESRVEHIYRLVEETLLPSPAVRARPERRPPSGRPL